MSIFSSLRKPRFCFNGAYIPAQDVQATADWYRRTFGCKTEPWTDEDGTKGMLLRFSDEDPGIAILPSDGDVGNEPPPILNTNRVADANRFLTERGANVGPIEQDAQGTKHFALRDCEGNEIEVSEEP